MIAAESIPPMASPRATPVNRVGGLFGRVIDVGAKVTPDALKTTDRLEKERREKFVVEQEKRLKWARWRVHIAWAWASLLLFWPAMLLASPAVLQIEHVRIVCIGAITVWLTLKFAARIAKARRRPRIT